MARIEAGFREGLTWQNVGKQLASGAVSGIASWAVGKLMDFVLADPNARSLPALLEDFRDQILEAMPAIIRAELEQQSEIDFYRQNLFEVTAKTDAVANKLRADVATFSASQLWDCYLEINQAKSSARMLDEPPPALTGVETEQTIFAAGFGIYHTVLGIFVAVCDALMSKSPIDPNVSQSAWTEEWYERIQEAVAEAKTHHWNVRVKLYERNAARISIDAVRSPGEPGPGQRWAVMLDGQFKRFLTPEEESNREQARIQEVILLNHELNEALIHPAMHIILEYDTYLANTRAWLNRLMVVGFFPTRPQ